MKKAVLKITTGNSVHIIKCRNREKLLHDFEDAANTVGFQNVHFTIKDDDITLEGMTPISFIDTASEDDGKRERLKTWMKWWSHLVKLGYDIE